MILIADPHVSQRNGNVEPFFAMLAQLAESEEDVVFLGDLFDLWIALPRYETDLHRRFREWCREQTSRRVVGLVEGNREFFVADGQPDCLTWYTTEEHRDDHGNLFTHGDLINPSDVRYRRFRRLVKNRTVKAILRALPFGPSIAMGIRHLLKRTNRRLRHTMPEEEIAAYAEGQFGRGVRTICAGHFHRGHVYRSGEQVLHLIPAWLNTRQVARLEPETGTIELDCDVPTRA